MPYRKLRIAWSVGCGILCLLLIALWVRSYARFDSISHDSKMGAYKSLFSLHGYVIYCAGNNPNGTAAGVIIDVGDKALQPFVDSLGEPPMPSFWGVRLHSSGGIRAFRELIVAVPYWLALLLAVICSGLSWLPWRFSLRTLLIATTLVAVVLGLIVYAAR